MTHILIYFATKGYIHIHYFATKWWSGIFTFLSLWLAFQQKQKKFIIKLILQTFYSMLDQRYHSEERWDSTITTTQILEKVQNEYYGLPYVPNTVSKLCLLYLLCIVLYGLGQNLFSCIVLIWLPFWGFFFYLYQ